VAFEALGHDTRLAVFRLLIPAGPNGLAAGEISERMGMPPNALSFHLSRLAQADLVTSRRAGRQIFYAVEYERLRGLLNFLLEDCCANVLGMPARLSYHADRRGSGGEGKAHHPVHGRVAQWRFARLAAGIAQQAVDAGFGKPPLPAPDRRATDPGAPCDRGHAHPLGRMEDDPSPRHLLLGAVAIADDRLNTSTILSRDQGTDDLSHGPSIAHLLAFVNPLFASAHQRPRA
jgi:ArsR family transcriptional regulator, arsenate/arsenite/antimonite-responsive transcriptional repressor